MKVLREGLHYVLTIIILMVMMIFFHAFNGQDLWIMLSLVFFYGFLGLAYLFNKTQKKMWLWVLPILLSFEVIVYVLSAVSHLFIFDTTFWGFITFIVLQWLVYTLVLADAVIVSKKYASSHVKWIILLGLLMLFILLFSKWTEFMGLYGQILLLSLIVIMGLLVMYVLSFIKKGLFGLSIQSMLFFIHGCCLIVYFVIPHSHMMYFMILLSLFIQGGCLIYPKIMFDRL